MSETELPTTEQIVEDELSILQEISKKDKETIIEYEKIMKKQNDYIKEMKNEQEKQISQLRIELQKTIQDINNNSNKQMQLKLKQFITKICNELLGKILHNFKSQLVNYYNQDNEELLSMIHLMNSEIQNLLSEFKVQISQVNIGDQFDATKHTLSSYIDTEQSELNNTIAEVIKNGFIYDNEVIYPDQVKVYRCI